MNGLLVIDKPGGMTSRAALDAAEQWFPRKTRLGHTGTLDPLATGVLVACVGTATRLAELVQGMPKAYAARFRLGATSDTDDADGTVTETSAEPPTAEQLGAALASFVGTIEQLPPAYSAVKVGGKRAHSLARRGREVSLSPRLVRVDAIRVVRYEWPFADVEVDCGKGTYIRSIARDVGAALGVGGLVQTLRRTRVGPFRAEQGVGLDADPMTIPGRLLPAAAAADGLPQRHVAADEAKRLRCGQAVQSPGDPADAVAVIGPAGELVGIGHADARGWLRATVVLDRWA